MKMRSFFYEKFRVMSPKRMIVCQDKEILKSFVKPSTSDEIQEPRCLAAALGNFQPLRSSARGHIKIPINGLNLR